MKKILIALIAVLPLCAFGQYKIDSTTTYTVDFKIHLIHTIYPNAELQDPMIQFILGNIPPLVKIDATVKAHLIEQPTSVLTIAPHILNLLTKQAQDGKMPIGQIVGSASLLFEDKPLIFSSVDNIFIGTVSDSLNPNVISAFVIWSIRLGPDNKPHPFSQFLTPPITDNTGQVIRPAIDYPIAKDAKIFFLSKKNTMSGTSVPASAVQPATRPQTARPGTAKR